mgnify:CR=1 FL=1
MLTTVPFSGFYNSLHDSEIDWTISQMFSDRATGNETNPGLESALFRNCDFRKVHTSYAADYCENFAEEFKLPSLKFESLDSPREYNFTTDRIFANIELSDLREALRRVDKSELANLAREKFTSRSGFMSFYNPDVNTWGDLATWDHNQCGTLLECLANNDCGDFDQYQEYNLMDRTRSNGYFENWIESATPNIQRLYKIHDYLETRAAR